MALTTKATGDIIAASDHNEVYNLLKGQPGAGEQVKLVYNAAGTVVIQPSSDPAASTDAIQINNNAGTVLGAITYDGKFEAADGAVGSPGLTFDDDTDTGFYRTGANSMAGVAGGTEQFRINATGFSVDGGTNYIDTAWSSIAGSTLTITQSGDVTYTQTSAKYKVIGKTALVQIVLTVTGTGTAANAIVLGGVPAAIAPAVTGSTSACGTFWCLDSGTTNYTGAVEATTASTMKFQVSGNANYMGAAPSFGLASGDILSLNLSYEVA